MTTSPPTFLSTSRTASPEVQAETALVTWPLTTNVLARTKASSAVAVALSTTPVAKAFVQSAPQRVVWGSDWPHPTEKAGAKPDDSILFDLLAEWAPDAALRQRILVDNPAELFGFPRQG